MGEGKMMNGRRSLLLLTPLLTLALGVALGFYYSQWRITRVTDAAQFMTAFVAYGEFLKTQRDQGTASSYEDALRGRIAFVDRNKDMFTEAFSERVFAIDQALTYAHLSDLEQKQGAVNEAKRDLDRATSFCPQIGWQNCAGDIILDFALRADKN